MQLWEHTTEFCGYGKDDPMIEKYEALGWELCSAVWIPTEGNYAGFIKLYFKRRLQ